MQRSIAEPAFLTDTRELPVVARPCAVAPPNMVATSHAGVRWSCLRLGHDVLLALGDERFELPHAFPTEMQQRVKVFRREISKPLRHASLKRQGATVLRMRRCCGVFTDRREAAQCIFGERTRNGGENGHHCAGGNSRKMTAELPFVMVLFFFTSAGIHFMRDTSSARRPPAACRWGRARRPSAQRS